jgi:hypothetical protein
MDNHMPVRIDLLAVARRHAWKLTTLSTYLFSGVSSRDLARCSLDAYAVVVDQRLPDIASTYQKAEHAFASFRGALRGPFGLAPFNIRHV